MYLVTFWDWGSLSLIEFHMIGNKVYRNWLTFFEIYWNVLKFVKVDLRSKWLHACILSTVLYATHSASHPSPPPPPDVAISSNRTRNFWVGEETWNMSHPCPLLPCDSQVSFRWHGIKTSPRIFRILSQDTTFLSHSYWEGYIFTGVCPIHKNWGYDTLHNPSMVGCYPSLP